MLTRMIRRLDVANSGCHAAKRIPGLENGLAAGFSRWPGIQMRERDARVTEDNAWKGQDIGNNDKTIFQPALPPRLPKGKLDERRGITLLNYTKVKKRNKRAAHFID